MRRSFLLLAVLFFADILVARPARADWPARVFAPYVYVTRSGTQLTDCYNATGQKYFTMAFVNADRAGTDITWGARSSSISSHFYASQIAAIRAKGGDIIMSFGGAGANELAMAEKDPVKLQAKYQAVVDEYKLTRIDMDIEGVSLQVADVNVRRNTALAGLQKANPGLRIDYTVSADPNRGWMLRNHIDYKTDGIGGMSLDMLRDAKQQGLKVDTVDIMTMDYGDRFDDDLIKNGTTMGEIAVHTAIVGYRQVQAIDRDTKMGICAMIGQNDVVPEVFTEADAKYVADWAKDKPWVTLLTFWGVTRDNGTRVSTRGSDTNSGIIQKPYAFTNAFKAFTVGFTPATQP